MIKKYFSLFISFFKASFIADLEYRMNFVSHIFIDILWYLTQIISMEVLFRHTQTIGDWNLQQIRVFLGLVFVIDSLYMIFLDPNLTQISDRVRKGDLDLLLAKPISSQFMISLQKISIPSFGNLIIALIWFVYAISNLAGISYLQLLWLILLIPSSFTVFYFLRFCFAITAVIFTRAEALQFMWYQLFKLGLRPDRIYAPWFRFLVLTLIPVGLVASTPARLIIEPTDYIALIWMIIYPPILLYMSQKYWNFCLKFYSSASS